MSHVPSDNNAIEVNLFQRYLIPSDSKWVGRCMQKADSFGKTSDFIYSRVLSGALVTVAVAMSFFNAISYVLQIPFKALLNVVRFNPVDLVLDIGRDITNVIRSYAFVMIGIYLIVLGFLYPKQVYSHFAPEYVENTLEKLRVANLVKDQVIIDLEEKIQVLEAAKVSKE